jgi:hypothetical protein
LVAGWRRGAAHQDRLMAEMDLGVSSLMVVSIFRLSGFSFYGQPISFGREQIHQPISNGMDNYQGP